jgi:hypothetical protein
MRALLLVGLFSIAACGGGSSDAVSGGPSCEALCDAATRCSEPGAGSDCVTLCNQQRGVFNQGAWTAYTDCVLSSQCESAASCLQRAIAVSSRAPTAARAVGGRRAS